MRVLAYCVHGTLSYSILRDVAAELRRCGAEVLWDFAGSHMFSAEETARIIDEDGLELADRSFKPDIAIHADPRCPPRRGCPVIEIPHGLASKIGYYLPDIQMNVDAHLAVSDWYGERIRAWHPHVKIFTTGMPKLDRYWSLEHKHDHIVYAPTFTRALTCWPEISHEADLIAESEPSILRLHRVQTEKLDIPMPFGIQVDMGLDICEAFARARVVVSDTSSAFLEAMALGIPVVCYLTKGAKAMFEKRPCVEKEFLKYAVVISEPSALRLALTLAKPAPQEVQEQLLSYRGKSVSRAAEVILGFGA